MMNLQKVHRRCLYGNKKVYMNFKILHQKRHLLILLSMKFLEFLHTWKKVRRGNSKRCLIFGLQCHLHNTGGSVQRGEAMQGDQKYGKPEEGFAMDVEVHDFSVDKSLLEFFSHSFLPDAERGDIKGDLFFRCKFSLIKE